MDQAERIVMTGVGLVTSVGHDSVSATAAIRAGISRFRTVPNYKTSGGAQVAGGLATGLTDARSGTDRLLTMAVPALQEALFTAEQFYHELDYTKSRLLVCVGPADRSRYEAFGPADMAELLEAAEAQSLAPAAEILQGGHAVGVAALHKAVTLLRETELKACVVGAVDSLVEAPVLTWLDQAGRLKTDDRPAGFIPGEAAAFLVLERESDARRRGARLLAEISAPALAREEAHSSSGLPLRGSGLGDALKQSIQPANGSLNGIICDLNGEYYRSKEWTLALPRVFDGAAPIPELWHPAENIGDVGAASAIVFVALAAGAIQRNYFPGPRIAVWASSDDALRGSVLVGPGRSANGKEK